MPGRDSGSRVPPIASTSRFASGRPSPVPSTRARSAPSRSKGVKTGAISASSMPGPVSAIDELRLAPASAQLAGDR